MLAALSMVACSGERAGSAGSGEASPASPVTSAQAVAASDCTLQPVDAWVRMAPGAMPMHGGFVRIDNPCAAELTIVSASSPSYASIELHETRMEDGMHRMRQVPALPVPAEGSIELAPGGLHLMLMQPVEGLVPGQTVQVEFLLQDGQRVQADFQLRSAG